MMLTTPVTTRVSQFVKRKMTLPTLDRCSRKRSGANETDKKDFFLGVPEGPRSDTANNETFRRASDGNTYLVSQERINNVRPELFMVEVVVGALIMQFDELYNAIEQVVRRQTCQVQYRRR